MVHSSLMLHCCGNNHYEELLTVFETLYCALPAPSSNWHNIE